MESSAPARFRRPVLWPGLWIPLLLVAAGLLVTGITANIEGRRAMALAEARYYAQHQALVNHLLANVPNQSEAGDSSQPVSVWLQALFSDTLPDSLGLRIDTLERHTKMPLLEIRTNGSVDPTRALRTEVSPLDQHWILTTVPSPEGLEEVARAAEQTVWIAGFALSVFAASLALLLNRRLHLQTLHNLGLEQREIGADHQIANFQVEKSILRQALNDSEQRSRDLVALSGAVIWELDENGRIGFVSPQIAELLDRAPADLVGQPLEELVAPAFQSNYRRALAAARSDRTIQRIDLPLLHRNQEAEVPVVLRVRALKDPVHGLSGFRISTLQRLAV
ncbi:PAS domain-containing protein [Marinobacter adhaerens]|uniref:PAS domain-containing protein n=1 Tax=Marinobacter adhaerens TaxID=1033846 RepID=UPI001E4DAF14|nr:PAS domain-containing protein [Marinobacter adhaerens]MCD1646199.1 PAS domain-containing protein [Marinobacter adhaerens]